MTDNIESLDALLGLIEGTKVQYVEVTDDAKNPYCDSCSEPITPNSRVQLYGADRLIDGRRIDPFRLLRLHCEDCFLNVVHFPHEGTTEFLVSATIDTDWKLHDPEIRAYSLSGEGIPWGGVEVLEGLLNLPWDEIQMATGFESQGPLDVVDVLVQCDVDPRQTIQEDGTITLPDDAHENFLRSGIEIMEESGGMEGLPPQPSVAEKLRAYADTEPPEDDG